MDTNLETSSTMEAEESLLYSARHGEVSVVKALLEAAKGKKLNVDINCKGRNKANLGWTPLHLATYFGHVDVVKELLDAGVNVDEVNETGDTALHKACFIGNEELVILLLRYRADVNIMNGEGRTPIEVSKTRDVQRLVEAASRAERLNLERALLAAARDGKVEDISELLSSGNPPNINCADAQGNTSLHCAAYRGHARVAVLLLQNGVDTTMRNHCGQLAIDLAKDAEMREVLNVRPLQRLKRTAAKFEGPLLKRSRFLGWRPVWAVLQRGVLLYYATRRDAEQCLRRRGKHYLDDASVVPATGQLQLRLSDGDLHRLAVPRNQSDGDTVLQSWVEAFNEHISYSGHYLWAGATPDSAKEATEDDGDNKPLGSMQDALNSAAASLSLLETQLKECGAIVAALESTGNIGNSLHQSAFMRFQHAVGSGHTALTALTHCAEIITSTQQAERAKLETEIERNRVLEEALAALARTHHALEMSVAEELTKSKRKKKSSASVNSSKENFYDVFDAALVESDDDTLITAGLDSPLGALSPWDSPEHERRTPIGGEDGDATPTNSPRRSPHHPTALSSSQLSLHSALSPASSLGTLVSTGGHVYRNARKRMLHLSSSQWSL